MTVPELVLNAVRTAHTYPLGLPLWCEKSAASNEKGSLFWSIRSMEPCTFCLAFDGIICINVTAHQDTVRINASPHWDVTYLYVNVSPQWMPPALRHPHRRTPPALMNPHIRTPPALMCPHRRTPPALMNPHSRMPPALMNHHSRMPLALMNHHSRMPPALMNPHSRIPAALMNHYSRTPPALMHHHAGCSLYLY